MQRSQPTPKSPFAKPKEKLEYNWQTNTYCDPLDSGFLILIGSVTAIADSIRGIGG